MAYAAQYTVYTAEGRKRKTLHGKTRQEVAARLAKALLDRKGGFVFDAGNLTLGKYLDRWLNDSVRGSVRQRTFERQEQIVRVNIKPALGRLKLKSLTPAHVRELYREKPDAGLAPGTVRCIHTVLGKALKQAVADGLIPRNPAGDGEGPKACEGRDTPALPGTGRRLPSGSSQ